LGVDITGSPPPDQHGPPSARTGPGGPLPEPVVDGQGGGAQPTPDYAVPAQVGAGSAAGAEPGPSHLVRYLAVYTVLRLALVLALTAVLAFFMPLIVALLFAIIVQLPLAWLLFAGPRRRVNDAMAQASAKRRAERARLQTALTGEVDPG
jgi:hypothetical protein